MGLLPICTRPFRSLPRNWARPAVDSRDDRAGGIRPRIVVERCMVTMTHARERPKAHSSDQAEKMGFTIQRIGVIGAGQMGNGIAHVAALAGMDVLLNDISGDRINAGLATINGHLARQVSRQKISEDERKATLAHIAPAETLEALGDC